MDEIFITVALFVMALLYGYLILFVCWMSFSWWWKSLNLWFAALVGYTLVVPLWLGMVIYFQGLQLAQIGFVSGYIAFALLNRRRFLPWRSKMTITG